MYYVEIRSTVRRSGPPRLVPLAEVGNYTGFRTIVAYDATMAERIRELGGTKGLYGIQVYADTLFIDFDNVQPTGFRSWLQAQGLAYTEWDTGNRSVHFHIPLTPVFGSWVPEAMKAWVQANSPEKADLSFYHAVGVYRLPGTFHPKAPGRCKILVDQREGSLLTLTEPPPKVRAFVLPEDEAKGEMLFTMLMSPVKAGGRNQYAWRLAMTAAEAGLSFDEALDKVAWWNSRYCSPPLDGSVLIKQCESAYFRVSNR